MVCLLIVSEFVQNSKRVCEIRGHLCDNHLHHLGSECFCVRLYYSFESDILQCKTSRLPSTDDPYLLFHSPEQATKQT